MGVFGAGFGHRGDAGFSGPLLWVSSGVVGFNVAMFLRPVREIFRPARPDVGASGKSSPSKPKMGKICCFQARRASIFAETPLEGSHRASFFADQQSWDPAGRVCCAMSLAAGPVYWHP